MIVSFRTMITVGYDLLEITENTRMKKDAPHTESVFSIDPVSVPYAVGYPRPKPRGRLKAQSIPL